MITDIAFDYSMRIQLAKELEDRVYVVRAFDGEDAAIGDVWED